MAGNAERVPVRDLDTEAGKARDAAEKAKTEYLDALTNTESSAELKELLKSDYTLCAQLAKTAAEAALLASLLVLFGYRFTTFRKYDFGNKRGYFSEIDFRERCILGALSRKYTFSTGNSK